MISFIWKGKDSFSDFGILIEEKPPIPKAERNIDEIEIPGRNGDLTIDYNTYKPITFSLSCTLIDSDNIDVVKTWLDGFGNLIFNWQNDRYYKAKFINRIDIAQSLEVFGDFPIVFKAQPFAYALDTSIITLTTSEAIFNPSNVNSKPVIKVYGTGSIDLTLNSNTIHLTNIVDNVTIDSELMDCYKDTQLMNNNMLGEFPELMPGSNSISWAGTVTKIEITPNWRWL